MPGAVSFSLRFSTHELARKFVYEATRDFQVPCLRDGHVVHVIALDQREMLQILNIGHQLGGTNPRMRTL